MLLIALPPRLIYWIKVLSRFISIQIVVQALSFASGMLLIRSLSKEEYAYFTIANSMQATMNMLADSGISSALSAIGGRVWQDPYRFGQLINTAMQWRRYLAMISVALVSPTPE
jgi:flagellar biosynthesis regulator FlbT